MRSIKVIGVIGFIYLLAPALVVVAYSFNPEPYIAFPTTGLTLKWFIAFFHDSDIVGALIRSVEVAFGVSVLSTLLGTPAAIWLWRREGEGWSGLVNIVLLSPLFAPLIVLAVAIYSVYAQLHLIGSLPSLAVGQTVLGLPMVVTSVRSQLSHVPRDLERAGTVLGGRPWQVLLRVTIPLAWVGIATGAIFAFAVSFDELLIALYVAGVQGATLPVKIWEQLRTQVGPEITAVAAFLMGVSMFVLLLAGLVRARGKVG